MPDAVIPPFPLPTVGALRALVGNPTVTQFGWMLLACPDVWDHMKGKVKTHGCYAVRHIPKRSGKPREICAPRWLLKQAQRTILSTVLAPLAPHPAAHGFVPGRSVVTNAAPHAGASVVIKVDLKDFFPSVKYPRVVAFFRGIGYGTAGGRFSNDDSSQAVAETLARLCCYAKDPAAWGIAHLPQGAPTSPHLTNLMCFTMDEELTAAAGAAGAVYTRYADDLTFSFPPTVKRPDVARIKYAATVAVRNAGFRINWEKFRVTRPGRRQVVTGVVTNAHPNLVKSRRRLLRNVVYNCRTKGVESQTRGDPQFLERLVGHAAYYAMIAPAAGGKLLAAAKALQKGPP